MCIAIASPKGAILEENILRRCFEQNPHGAGFAIKNSDGTIAIEKGFMDIESLLERLNQLGQTKMRQSDMLVHFRIATDGGINQGNCHPFPISPSVADVKATKISTKRAFVHNGILMNFRPSFEDAKLDLSDTQLFGMKSLAKVSPYLKKGFTNRAVNEAITKLIGSSKVAILDEKGIHRYGKWISYKGNYYSNSSFEERRTSEVMGTVTFSLRLLELAPKCATDFRADREFKDLMSTWYESTMSWGIEETKKRVYKALTIYFGGIADEKKQ